MTHSQWPAHLPYCMARPGQPAYTADKHNKELATAGTGPAVDTRPTIALDPGSVGHLSRHNWDLPGRVRWCAAAKSGFPNRTIEIIKVGAGRLPAKK